MIKKHDTSPARRVAYGFKRSDKDFDHVKYDALFLDDAVTRRADWHDMISNGLLEGDTLIVLAEGDMGQGKGLLSIKASLARHNVTLEVAGLPVKPAKARRRGKHWKPTDEVRAKVCHYWQNPLYSRDYVRNKANELGEGWLTDNQLNTGCGPRNLKEESN